MKSSQNFKFRKIINDLKRRNARNISIIVGYKSKILINFLKKIKGIKINFIKSKPLKINLVNVISNSFGFGGTNATLIFEKI